MELLSEKTNQSDLNMNRKEKQLLSSLVGAKVVTARQQKLRSSLHYLTDIEEQGVQPSERELENVNEGIEQQETDEPSPPITAKQTEAQSLEENEDYPAPGPENQETRSLERIDVASWGKLGNKDRDEIAAKGPPPNPENLPKDETDRAFPTSIFMKFMPNGESIRRDWLVWSDSCQGLFCFSSCMLNESPYTLLTT